MNGKKKKYEKQLRKEEELLKKKRKKAKRRKNREYTIVSYFFVLIFVSLIGYMGYFNICLLYPSDAADDPLFVSRSVVRLLKKKT